LSFKFFEVFEDGEYWTVPFAKAVKNDNLYPIDFAYERPWSCVFGKSEIESLACRVMYFTKSWDAPITWPEYYETMTAADKMVSYKVEQDFNLIAPYLVSPEKCAEFAKSWAKIVDDFQTEKILQ